MNGGNWTWKLLLPIIVQIITGIIGGQAVGAAIGDAVMGQLPKILSGAIGGVGGAAILGACWAAAPSIRQQRRVQRPTAHSNLNNILGGAGGGAMLTGIVGAIMKSMNKA